MPTDPESEIPEPDAPASETPAPLPPPRPEPAEGQRPPLAPHRRIGEGRRGAKPGTRYVRVTASEDRPFRRTGERRWEATLAAEEPHSRVGRGWAATRRFLFGAPLATS